MQARTILAGAALLAGGVLIGWLAASGRVAERLSYRHHTPARAAGNFSHFTPIVPSPKRSARLYTDAHAKGVQGALLLETEETQASVDEPRGRASGRGEAYMYRAELRKKLVRAEQRATGCTYRQQTFQTATERLGDLGEPNVPRGTLGSAKSGGRGQQSVSKRRNRRVRPSPNG